MIQDIGVLLVSRSDPGPRGSLPLEDIDGRPLIERLLQQVRGWDRVRRGMVAHHRSLHGAIALSATTDPADDTLCEWAESIDLPYARSSTPDRASRVAEAADLAGFTWVAPIDPRDAIVDVQGFERAAVYATIASDLVTNRDGLGIAPWPVEIVRTIAIDPLAATAGSTDGLWGIDAGRRVEIDGTLTGVDARIRTPEDLARVRRFAKHESPDWSGILPLTVARWFQAEPETAFRVAA